MTLFSLSDFERDALTTLTEFCTIPCLSPMFDAHWDEHGFIEDAAQLLAKWARQRSFAQATVQLHRLEGRTPALSVTIESTAGAGTGTGDDDTVVLYGHLDKQPPLGEWSHGLDPFIPVRRENRLYARGASDDGYAIFSALCAIETMEKNAIAHKRCVVFIEASEESGSPDLEAHLDALSEHLGNVDLMICLDSGALTYDRLWVTSSLRGVLNAELTVEVMSRGQHSGSVSGVVPSSFRILRQLLDRVEDATTGDVLVPEMYADIPEAVVRSASDIADKFGDVIANELPVLEGVSLMGSSPAERLLRRTWYPTLSIIGMGGIPTPDVAGNVLRPFTTIVLSFRLPPNVDAQRAANAVERLLCDNVPSHARTKISLHAADGWVAPELAPWLDNALAQGSRDAFDESYALTGEGGSIPFLASLAKRYPGVQFVATGVGGPQSNAHGIDEMLDLPTVVGVTNAIITVLAAHATK